MAAVTEARRIAREKELAEWRERCRSWATSDVDVSVVCSSPVVETITVSSGPASESITNSQHAGVDEGGIVKRQGDILIVLRRGRLFTIGIGGAQLDALDVADAPGPGADDVEQGGTWYDELLVREHTVVVIGFSYSRGGSEIGLFDLGANGDLRHRSTYHLRSDDYYSSTNYASRLIGERLFLYSTFRLPERNHLNVVVAHPGDVVNLLRLPLSSFSDGSVDAPSWRYRPIAYGLGPWLTTRFAGPYVLVGAQRWSDAEEPPRTIAVAAWESGGTFSLTLTHDAQRIETMGAHAVVVGSDAETLSMTAIRLGPQPSVAGVLFEKDAFQSEARSHAFFYREDTGESGVLGLPIVTVGGNEGDDTRGQTARILFVRNRGLSFVAEGALDASPEVAVDDDCRVSCFDWYGDARPLFVDGRIFALLGYEIVEGRLVGGRVETARRLDFTPRLDSVRRRG